MIRFLLLALTLAAAAPAADWLQFRGPNAAGVAESGAPTEIGPDRHLIWKTPLPPGHSSPVVAGDRIYLTAVENEALFTLALDRATGKILWKKQAPRDRVAPAHEMNNAASPSPVSNGRNVFVFFGDYGLLAYSRDGDELWRLPAGPFENDMGMGASPILADGKLIMSLDADIGSHLLALDPANGEILWRADRSELTRGFSTPTLYQPPDGPARIILPGAFQLAAYSAADGKKLWWANGLCWQPKTVALVADGRVYANCWAAGGDAPPERTYPNFEEALAELDANGDGLIQQEEFYEKLKIKPFDLDHDGRLNKAEWRYFQARNLSQNGLLAVRLGGSGDVTTTHVEWTFAKPLPNIASPVLYEGMMYLVKDGGILAAVDAATGEPHKTGRLSGAMGKYFASPVAADGKIYFLDETGVVTVIEAGPDWRILHSWDSGEGGNATPAIVDGRIYLRTHENLYCFGETR